MLKTGRVTPEPVNPQQPATHGAVDVRWSHGARVVRPCRGTWVIPTREDTVLAGRHPRATLCQREPAGRGDGCNDLLQRATRGTCAPRLTARHRPLDPMRLLRPVAMFNRLTMGQRGANTRWY